MNWLRKLLIPKYSLLIIIITIIRCSNPSENDELRKTEKALIIWGGDYEVDGCGFTIEIGEKIFKPENEDFIPEEYKIQPPTEVKLTFILLNKNIEYFCGMAPTKNEGIKIIFISKL